MAKKIQLDPLYKEMAKREWIVYPAMQVSSRFVEIYSVKTHCTLQLWRHDSREYDLHYCCGGKTLFDAHLTALPMQIVGRIGEIADLLDGER